MSAAAPASSRAVELVAVSAVILLVWQALFEVAGDVAITPPLRTFAFAGSLLATSSFWSNTWGTMQAFLLALAISAVAGTGLGLLLGLRRFAGDVMEPVLASLYTIPKVTLYPVMLLVFGLGLSAKVAFGVIHGMIPIVLFTLGAVKNIPPVYLRAARALRLDGRATTLHILVPAVLPEMFSGLRVGFSLTMLGVLIGEMFASQRGLGFLIINGISQHHVRMTTAVTLLIVVFAIAANTLLLALDRKLHHGAAVGHNA